MGVLTIHRYRTLPGKFAEHVALTNEGCELLRNKGVAVSAWMPIAGNEPGVITIAGAHSDFREYAATESRVNADPEFQAFWGKAMTSAAADAVDVAILVDADPSYVSPDQLPGVIQSAAWRPQPGRIAKFVGDLTTAVGHLTRLGARTRVLQTQIGGDPMTTVVTIGFDDLAHYGEFADKFRVDEQWQSFWAEALNDPSADMVRSGLYVPLPG